MDAGRAHVRAREHRRAAARQVWVVMGNEASDADSIITALTMAYLTAHSDESEGCAAPRAYPRCNLTGLGALEWLRAH